jgi:polyhydroxybutyrate depolymerase
MAHRLACEVPGITAIASVAGAAPTAGCLPPKPVAVLQVHGDRDDVVRYAGGRALDLPALAPHPSAEQTAGGWARLNRCSLGAPRERELDLHDELAGNETRAASFSGCAAVVELWTVRGGSHFVAMNHRALDAILAFLEGQRG